MYVAIIKAEVVVGAIPQKIKVAYLLQHLRSYSLFGF